MTMGVHTQSVQAAVAAVEARLNSENRNTVLQAVHTAEEKLASTHHNVLTAFKEKAEHTAEQLQTEHRTLSALVEKGSLDIERLKGEHQNKIEMLLQKHDVDRVEDKRALEAAKLGNELAQTELKHRYEQIEQRLQTDLKEATSEKNRLLTEAQHEISTLTNNLTTTQHSHKNELERAHMKHHAEITALHNEKAILQSSSDTKLDKLRSEHRLELEKQRASSKSHELLAETFGDRVNTSIQDLTNIIQADKHQVAKGAEGERWVLDFLSEHYGACAIEKTSGTKHSADIKITVGTIVILLEVRNYEGSVPKDRRSSLARDVEVQDAHGGIMVSLRSGIVGVEDMYLEITSERKPIVYLHNVLAEPFKLKGAISMVVGASKSIELFNPDEKTKYLSYLEEAAQNVKDMSAPIKQVEKLRASLHGNMTKHRRLLMDRKGANVATMTVADMRGLLLDHGEPTTGTKNVLIRRLLEAKLAVGDEPVENIENVEEEGVGEEGEEEEEEGLSPEQGSVSESNAKPEHVARLL